MVRREFGQGFFFFPFSFRYVPWNRLRFVWQVVSPAKAPYRPVIPYFDH